VQKGRVVGAVFRKNKIGEFDKHGRRAPLPTDETLEVKAESIIVAIGQDLDASFTKGFDGVSLGKGRLIETKKGLATSDSKIFAGGDAVLGPASVIEAIGHGKLAARSIDVMLSGEDRFPELERLNFTGYSMVEPKNEQTMPRQHSEEAEAAKRTCGFDEVVTCLDPKCANKESARCLRCDLSAGGDD
jgi:hypothetical protein